jgi:hypothetical protein
MEAIMVDRTAAAAAVDRHITAEENKDNVFELFWESNKATSTDEIATLSQNPATEDKAQSTPIDRAVDAAAEIATIRQQLAVAAARMQEKANSTPMLDDLRERMADPPKLDAEWPRLVALLDAGARTRRATAQGTHGRAAGSANAASEWPRLVALLIAGELGFVGMA